jgi:hypothetical protein
MIISLWPEQEIDAHLRFNCDVCVMGRARQSWRTAGDERRDEPHSSRYHRRAGRVIAVAARGGESFRAMTERSSHLQTNKI